MLLAKPQFAIAFSISCTMLAVANELPVSAAETSRSPATAEAIKPTSETRFVQYEKAAVHCGPADDHYVTCILARGAAVEVYHQSQDGWCGIRPPEGSHDWLAADQAYLLPGGKQAEVVGNKTPAWIGAEESLGDQRFRWQIELQPTQKVEVIGELQQAIDTDKVRMWYKILPPPGEFRWIRAESLATTPLKSRSTTVTLASAEEKTGNSEEGTRTAAYTSTARKKSNPSSLLVHHAVDNQPSTRPGPVVDAATEGMIEREPVAGEYIEGQGVVVGSPPDSWSNHEGYIDDQGYIVEETMVDGEEWVVDGADLPCATCNRLGCVSCDATHQTDSFQQWDASVATGNTKLRFRPLGRILGLIGLSVVEGERVEDVARPPCPVGCGCLRCRQGIADLSPRASGRLSHLPRPTRRVPGSVARDWLGSNDGLEPDFDRPALADDRDSTGRDNHSGTWHGIASARLGSSLGSVQAGADSKANQAGLMKTEPVIAASAQADNLHFSTPEIQQAMIELTRVVAQSIERWDFRDHAARAQNWIDQAADPIARGEARLLLERIESFELLRRRSQTAAETAYAASPSNDTALNQPLSASLAGFQRPADMAMRPASSQETFPAGPAGVQRNADGTPASDASGWLVEVHSAEYGQPQFALTDDYGGLIAYVQPSPGMNLGRYLKQPVGIYGAKGYLPNLSARQIVVERIVRLR